MADDGVEVAFEMRFLRVKPKSNRAREDHYTCMTKPSTYSCTMDADSDSCQTRFYFRNYSCISSAGQVLCSLSQLSLISGSAKERRLACPCLFWSHGRTSAAHHCRAPHKDYAKKTARTARCFLERSLAGLKDVVGAIAAEPLRAKGGRERERVLEGVAALCIMFENVVWG